MVGRINQKENVTFHNETSNQNQIDRKLIQIKTLTEAFRKRVTDCRRRGPMTLKKKAF